MKPKNEKNLVSKFSKEYNQIMTIGFIKEQNKNLDNNEMSKNNLNYTKFDLFTLFDDIPSGITTTDSCLL